ncbi:signal peptidase I [Kaarinaea lacus]
MQEKPVHSLPGMAAAVALIIPPLGMMVVCRPFSALGYGLFTLASWLSAYVMQVDAAWPHARIFFPPVIVVHVVAAFHAYRVAQRTPLTAFQDINRRCLIGGILLVVLALLIYLPTRSNFTVFNIASASMAPALLQGDKVIAKKLSTTAANIDELKRADIIIFRHPEKNEYQVKRIIGLPGDRLRFSRQKLTLNDKPVSRQLIMSRWQPEDGLRWLQLPLYEERLAGHRYRILIQDDLFGPQGEVQVPANNVFVMGDNRNMSIDSRNFGAIPATHIVAKPMFIGFSSLSVSRWLVRWRRIGFLDGR